jgi:3-hydroxymyristoyl/3-hydroxydecanoyl-(acyl carrier protein) dehydratase
MTATIPGLELLEWSESGGSLRARYAVAPDSPFFRGHFPSRPIFPAVGQLLLAQRAAEVLRAPARVTGVSAARFKSPIGPGDALELALGAGRAPDALSFRLTRGTAAVASGTLALAATPAMPATLATLAATTAPAPIIAEAPPPPTPPIDVEELLPQRPPALLVERVLDWSAGRIRCAIAAPAESPLAIPGAGGALAGLAAIECAAQAAATLEGLARRARGASGRRAEGLLVACRAARVGAGAVPAGAVVEVEHVASAGLLHDYRGRVVHRGELVAEAEIATYAEA